MPPDPDTPAPSPATRSVLGWRRWFGTAGFIAVGILLLGRLALEPLRSLPHYDEKSMEAFGAVETFQIRLQKQRPSIAFFGSSQTIWGIATEECAKTIGIAPEECQKFGIVGGTPFDQWSLVRRNPDFFSHLSLAVIEANPFVLRDTIEHDSRVSLSLSQHALFRERLEIGDRAERRKQLAEYLVPLQSVRRPLLSVILSLADPAPGWPAYPSADKRIYPLSDWYTNGMSQIHDKARHLITPKDAAKKMVGKWKLSPLNDASLRHLLTWFSERSIPVVIHELPIHSEVAAAMQKDPDFSHGYHRFLDYLKELSPAPAMILSVLEPGEFGETDRCMADRTHMNELGARSYSHLLGEKIAPLVAEKAKQAHPSRGTPELP